MSPPVQEGRMAASHSRTWCIEWSKPNWLHAMERPHIISGFWTFIYVRVWLALFFCHAWLTLSLSFLGWQVDIWQPKGVHTYTKLQWRRRRGGGSTPALNYILITWTSQKEHNSSYSLYKISATWTPWVCVLGECFPVKINLHYYSHNIEISLWSLLCSGLVNEHITRLSLRF